MTILTLAFAVGIAVGLLMKISVPAWMLTYLGVVVLAALDSCFGGVKASLEQTFDDKNFALGFLTNILLAGFIVFIGDRIGLRELYLAAVVAFGVRIFQNLATVRQLMFSRKGWE